MTHHSITAESACDRLRKRLVIKMGVCLLLGMASGSVYGANREAARKVQAGIAKHSAGEFAEAEKAFTEAANMLPNDLRVAYDQACALAAQGKHDEAEKLFSTARLAHDPVIVAASDYNLGCLDAAKAQAKFGEKPEDATSEVRKEGLELIRQAVGHYRDCLAAAPNHDKARHNLEVLRLWMKHIEEVWRQRDREKRRQEMNLLQFLEAIETDQTMLRNTSTTLAATDDSPRRRQAGTMASHAQRELAEEIPFLQEKIRGTLLSAATVAPSATGASGNPPLAPPQPDPRLAQAVDSLVETAGQSRTEMSRAVTDLATNVPHDATSAQTKALDKLDELYRAVAPFEHVLQRSIATEERLTDDTRRMVDANESSTAPANATPPVVPSPPAGAGSRGAPGTDTDTHVDAKERAREQRIVANWVETLAPKAQQQLAALKAAPPPLDAPAATPNNTPPSNSGNPGASPASPAEDAAARAQLATAYEKAIELGPQAHTAASNAIPPLEEKQWASALTNQEEALRLLKEIAEAMPKQPPQDKQDQEKDKEQEKDQQQKQDSGNSQQQDQQEQSQDKNDKKKDNTSREPSQPPKSSPQNSEMLLRQVRQREREYKERQKEMRGVIVGGVPVDKDW